MPPVQVSGIDHIVLRVQDPLRSVQWYADTLGLEPVRVEAFKAGELGMHSCLGAGLRT